MKECKFRKVILVSCIIILGLTSISLAGKPSFEHYPYPGYVMFNDDPQFVIRSDGDVVYTDCSHGGTDMVKINIWDDGTFQGLQFYPGVMKEPFYNCPSGKFSPRSVKFDFNVSGISEEQPAGDQAGNAVREILRWYRDAEDYAYRSDSTGYIDEGLHTPMYLYRTGHAWIQFVIDPEPADNPGAELAVTQANVNGFYDNDTDKSYRCTEAEPEPYVVYTLDYGRKGVDVQPVELGKSGEPITWIIKTKDRNPGDPVRLYVTENKKNAKAIYLADYESLHFELAVSTEELTTYPTPGLAPAKHNTVAVLWGEIKGE